VLTRGNVSCKNERVSVCSPRSDVTKLVMFLSKNERVSVLYVECVCLMGVDVFLKMKVYVNVYWGT